jgi:protein TonB
VVRGSDPAGNTQSRPRYGAERGILRGGSLLASLLLNAGLVASVAVAFGASERSGRRAPEALVTIAFHADRRDTPPPSPPSGATSKATRSPPAFEHGPSPAHPAASEPLPISLAGTFPLPDAATVLTPAPPASQQIASQAPAIAEPRPSETAASVTDSYRQTIWKRILAARPRGASGSGRVIVRFRLDREGALVSAEVAQSSGQFVLDRLALQAVRRAAPFTAPPIAMPDNALIFRVPLDFHD